MELSSLTPEQIKATHFAVNGYTDGEAAKTLKELEDKVIGRWCRRPDWHDIKAIFEADTDPNKRWIFLVTDGNKTITLRHAELGGAYYRTSDGATYTGTGDFVHTWDTAKDKPCGQGYKTRYVTVYNATRNVVCDVSKIDAVYCCLGDCHATKLAGSGSATSSNTILEAVECGDKTTASENAINAKAFFNCYSLVFAKIPEGVASIGSDAFYTCSSLTSVCMPESVASIETNAFIYCYSLASVHIPLNVARIGIQAFGNCHALRIVNIPKNVTTIGDHAFYRCRSLASINISEGVSGIGNNVFDSCSSLASVSIPASVADMGVGVFQLCVSLEAIVAGFDWKAPAFDISASNRLSIGGLVNLFARLKDNTGNQPVTIVIGASNKAKMSAEQSAIAEGKNYIIA